MQESTPKSLSLTYCLTLLSRYLRRQQARVLLLAVLLLGTIGLQLVNPQVVRCFIDAATSGGTHQTLVRIAILFLIVAVTNQLVSLATAYTAENVGWIVTNELRADLALHCLNLDMSFHTAHAPGELIERIDGDVSSLAGFFSQFVIRVLGSLLLVLGILVMLFLVDWRVGAVLLLYTVTTLVLLSRLWTISVPYAAARREIEARLSGFLEERLAGTEDVGANGGCDYVIWRLLRLSQERLRRGRKASIIGGLVIGIANVLFMLCNVIGLVLGAYLYFRGRATVGTVCLIYAYSTLLFWPLRQITLQVDQLQKAGAGIQRIRALFELQASILEPPTPDKVEPSRTGPPSVRFENVSLAYAANEPVLHHLCFEIQAGQVLGLLGRTGGGKTSITRLLLRLYDPTAGIVRLSGVDISQIKLATLRQHVGLVTQDVQLFHATVRDNLTFYDPHISDKQIAQVLDELGLQAWYQALPAGMDARLDPNKLSAGEAQLLALARIFLRDPGLVILDEASSRLDPATEQRLDVALSKLLRARTGIIVAHRLSTVQRADYIMILSKGQVLEYGPRQSLAADPTSCFCRLLQTGLDLTQAAEAVLS